MEKLNYSRQREAIMTCLANTTDHPTAAEVYAQVRKEYPHISLGTVYRNLSLLVETGQAKRLVDPEGTDHFDANTRPHAHFICNGCMHVIDFPLPLDEVIDRKVEEQFSGRIDSHEIFFYGLCESCIN